MVRRVLLGVGALCALVPLLAEVSHAATNDIVLTAHDAVDVHGHWSRVADSSVASGVLLASSETGWQNTTAAAPAPTHYVDFTFRPLPNTPYRVWLRLRAPGGSKYNDSVFVQFSNARDRNNTARYRLGTSEALLVNRQSCNGCALNGWGWYDGAYWLTQPAVLSFSGSESQTLRVQTREDGVEIDQIVLSPVTFLAAAPGPKDNDTTLVTGITPALSAPFTGIATSLPGTIAADAFDAGAAGVAYHDTTLGNSGDGDLNTHVDLKRLASGAYAVSWIAAGEWLNYSVDVAAAGDYIIEADLAAEGAGGSFHINVNGENLTGVVSIPNTGSVTTFTTIKRRVMLAAGPQTMTIVFDGQATKNASLAAIRVTPHAPIPYTGGTVTVPGVILAERFDNGGQGISSYDTTAGNDGGQFRAGEVDIFGSATAGYYVGATAAGEWLEYGINVGQPGQYTLHFEVASATDMARLHAQFPNVQTDSIEVPNTGAATNWTTVATVVDLKAGEQIMRVGIDASGLSLRSIRLERAARAGNTLVVAAGGNLQAAINAAEPGDTIVLEAGATYVGNFTLPAKTGDAYVTIRSAAADAWLPAEGVRMTPAFAPYLPKLRSPNTQPALATEPYAHHYRIQFVEFLANANGAGNIVSLGDGSAAQNTLAVVPHHLIIDRVYIHGDVTLGQKRGIALQSAETSIINSYISEIKAVGQDSQAIGGWNGPGPYLISNNYLEAAGENVMFGGADPAIPELVPSDITFTRNHLFKPLSWRGSSWSVKNIFELKSAQRVLIDSNVMENNWLAAQSGYAVLLKSVNQDGTAPWSVVQDIVFTNNIVRHVSSAINILGRDTRFPAIEANNIVIRNNLFDDVSAARYGGSGRFLQINGGVDITIDHNTIISDGATVVSADVNQTLGFVFTNNVLQHNLYGIKGSGTAIGNATLATYFPNSQVFGGLYIGAKAYLYPAANFFPATVDAVGFVNYAGGDYRLSDTSLYRGVATDGTNPGVDHAALNGAYGAAR